MGIAFKSHSQSTAAMQAAGGADSARHSVPLVCGEDSIVNPSGLWTRPVVRAGSSWNVQAAGGLRAPFHLNPWHLQTWPGAGRTVSAPTFPLLSPTLSRPGTLEKAVSWPSRQRWSLEGRSGARIPAQNTKKKKKNLKNYRTLSSSFSSLFSTH